MNPYQRLVEAFARTRFGAGVAKRIATAVDRRLLRWTKGRFSSGVGTSFGKKILLLTTRGAKSGQLRSVPLLYTLHGDDVILIASNGGGEQSPAWFFNLKKNPACEVDIHGTRRACIAREVEGEERETLWRAAVENYPGYADYQRRVTRSIPVIRLDPAGDR